MLNRMSNKELLEIYILAQNDYFKFKNHISIHWQRYFNNNNVKKFNNENNLKNFRNEKVLSVKLDDVDAFQNKINLLEISELFDQDFLKNNLPTSNVGNSNYSKNFFGFYLDSGIIFQLKWYEEIHKIVFKNTKNIIEIGGGFGELARIILNNHDVKYILIDLPEANLLSHFYLKEHYPNKKIYSYKNYLENPILKSLDNFDIFILTPNCEIDKSLKIDFFINTRSMMEMNFNIIKTYFKLIHNNIADDGFFLNINRYEKSSVGEKIRIQDYPYDNNWDVIISKPSFKQSWVHFLLTQRKFKNFQNNIKNELNKIKNINEFTTNKNKILLILLEIKIYLKKITYKIIKKFLYLIFKKKLKKIGKVFYGMSE